MNADCNGNFIPLGNRNRVAAIFDAFADGEHRRYAGSAGPSDDLVAVGLELGVVYVAMRVDHGGSVSSSFGKSGAPSAVCVIGASPPQACSEVDQSSSIRPG